MKNKRRYLYSVIVFTLFGLLIGGGGVIYDRFFLENQQDEIVVGVAEKMMWDFAQLEGGKEAILYYLAEEGIVVGADKDPFDKHKDCIAYKADFYREMMGWGKLPPVDLMLKAGVIEEPQPK